MASVRTQSLVALACVVPILGGCSGDDATAKEVCPAVASAECPDPGPHYAEVAPIFEQRCASCHTGEVDAPWPLDSYENVADWQPLVLDDLRRCSMPPADSGITMTLGERERLLTWLRCGYPE